MCNLSHLALTHIRVSAVDIAMKFMANKPQIHKITGGIRHPPCYPTGATPATIGTNHPSPARLLPKPLVHHRDSSLIVTHPPNTIWIHPRLPELDMERPTERTLNASLKFNYPYISSIFSIGYRFLYQRNYFPVIYK